MYRLLLCCMFSVCNATCCAGACAQVEWRQWLTERLIQQYLDGRSFYRIQTGSLMDNPDQRITSDVSQFTSITLGFFFTILGATTDLVAFAGILFSIYPPLFAVLIIYALGYDCGCATVH